MTGVVLPPRRRIGSIATPIPATDRLLVSLIADALRPLLGADVAVDGDRGRWSLRTAEGTTGSSSYGGPTMRTAHCRVVVDGHAYEAGVPMADAVPDDGRTIAALCVATLDAVAGSLGSIRRNGDWTNGDGSDLLALAAAFPEGEGRPDADAPTTHGPATLDGSEPGEPAWRHGPDALDLLRRIDARMDAHLALETGGGISAPSSRVVVRAATPPDVVDPVAAIRALAALLDRAPRR